MRAAGLWSLLFVVLTSALYEEPPGGCQGPPDDFVPIPEPPRQMYQEPPGGCAGPADGFDLPLPEPKRRRAQRPPPPPPKVDPDAVAEAAAEEMERQLYEQESMDMMELPEDDWDAIEQAHLNELFYRMAFQRAAAVLTIVYVIYLIWGRLTQVQGTPPAQPSKEAVKATASVEKSSTDAKAEPKGTEAEDRMAEEKAAAVDTDSDATEHDDDDGNADADAGETDAAGGADESEEEETQAG